MKPFRALSAIMLSLLELAGLCIAPSIALADVQITGLADFTLGSWSGSGDMQNSDPVAVCNSAGSGYTITASGSGAGGSLTLASGGNTLAYDVAFRGSTGGWVTLTANSAQGGFSSAYTDLSSCPGASNADVRITVPAANLRAALAGSYSGTLTITLGPE